MEIPTTLPAGLSEEFAHDASKQEMWKTFLKKNDLAGAPLPEVLATLRSVLMPALQAAAQR